MEALPQFEFRKLGVTADGLVRVEIVNRSSVELRWLTVGVRSESGMEGACALPVAGLAPGTSKTIEADLYRGSMNPERVQLFRLPVPDPEDRLYYMELDVGGQGGLA